MRERTRKKNQIGITKKGRSGVTHVGKGVGPDLSLPAVLPGMRLVTVMLWPPTEVVTAQAASKVLPSTVVIPEKVMTVGVASTTVIQVEGVALGALWLSFEILLRASVWKFHRESISLGSHLAVAPPCRSVLNWGDE